MCPYGFWFCDSMVQKEQTQDHAGHAGDDGNAADAAAGAVLFPRRSRVSCQRYQPLIETYVVNSAVLI